MKIIVNSTDYKNAIDLCSKKFNGIIVVGIKNFSNGTSCKLSKNQILTLQKIALKHKKQIFVLLDVFIFEDYLKDLENTLNFLNEIKISGVVFNDFSINQIS
jgi:collagenase-like PrtC family protease